MIPDTPLRLLARSAAKNTDTDPSGLSPLTDLLFGDASPGFWHSLDRPLKGLLDEGLAPRQLADLAGPLASIGDQLRGTVPPTARDFPERLLAAREILEKNQSLFFLPQATPDERLHRLPLFAPMAVIHLTILGFLHTLALAHEVPGVAHLRHACDATAHSYEAYARQSVDDALAWRTDRLSITCTPMRSAMYGGPNLQITCIDTHIHQTIVDEICTAYPGTWNPLLQRTVDRISLYEEQIHRNAVLFWDAQVLDVVSEWNEKKERRETPAPPNRVEGLLDDALYLIMQDLGRALLERHGGLKN